MNNFPGSLIQNGGKLVRLNTSFGTIRYTVNGPTSTYNAFIAEFKGRFLKHGFIDTSYTRSASYDDAGTYPTVQSNTGNYSQYWAPSNWDVPNRVSMQVSYELPHLNHGPASLHYLTDGWKPTAITILQSGQPFTVLNTAAYSASTVAGAAVTTKLGDYNADGTNSDLPNIPTYGYSIPTDRNHQLGTRRQPCSDCSGRQRVPPACSLRLGDFTNPDHTSRRRQRSHQRLSQPGLRQHRLRPAEEQPHPREHEPAAAPGDVQPVQPRQPGWHQRKHHKLVVRQGHQPVQRPLPATRGPLRVLTLGNIVSEAPPAETMLAAHFFAISV